MANEIQYNVTAESEAINKYNNLKACIQHSMAGVAIPNLEEKKAEFKRIHGDIRELEGKPRERL